MKQADIIFKNINNENRVHIVLFHKDKILVQHMVEGRISYFQQLTDEELIDKLNYYYANNDWQIEKHIEIGSIF
jgi:hypothetical protein